MHIDYQIEILDKDFIESHFIEFYNLFAENTRGHELNKEISEEYIKRKAHEILQYFDTGSIVLLGAILEGRLIGILWSYRRVFLEEKRLYINTLIIQKNYRGAGIGRKLMLALEEIAKQKKINSIDVSTATFKEDAIHFYESLGYVSERVQLVKRLK